MDFDLHCHSNVSDGALAPGAVVQRAVARGVNVLALTDHDEVAGLCAARAAAQVAGIAFIDGIEISVTWRGSTIHIIGLGINPGDATLTDGLASLRRGRVDRARRMAEGLAAAGIPDALQGALRYAANKTLIGRTHFARYLAEIGMVSSMKAAFRCYLVPGRPGFVPHAWTDLGTALGWISGAGGQSVLAHPGRYALSARALEDLLGEFRAGGGEAIEVVTGSHSREQTRMFAALADKYGFLASRGSDFHAPGEGCGDFGLLPQLDKNLRPVWREWGL